MNKKYVIIGTSAAGLSAALQIRRLEPKSSVICISDELELPYNKCLLSSYCAGRRTHASVFTQFAGIECMLGSRVRDIHTARQQVVLETGKLVEYDSLFLGMGGKPVVPEVFRGNYSGIFTYYNLSDAQKILDYSVHHKISRVIIIGGGLNGLECADAFVQRGLKVALIEQQAHILPACYDPEGAEYLSQKLERAGIILYTGDTVQELLVGENKIYGVLCTSGKTVVGELIIIAAGMQAATQILEKTEIQRVQGSVVTNNFLQTNIPNIYAGGDCALVNNKLSHAMIRSSRWPDAAIQGMHAAYGMVGLEKVYPGVVPYAQSTLCELPVVVAGDLQVTASTTTQRVVDTDRYELRVFDKVGQLQGFLVMGTLNNMARLRENLWKGGHDSSIQDDGRKK